MLIDMCLAGGIAAILAVAYLRWGVAPVVAAYEAGKRVERTRERRTGKSYRRAMLDVYLASAELAADDDGPEDLDPGGTVAGFWLELDNDPRLWLPFRGDGDDGGVPA